MDSTFTFLFKAATETVEQSQWTLNGFAAVDFEQVFGDRGTAASGKMRCNEQYKET